MRFKSRTVGMLACLFRFWLTNKENVDKKKKKTTHAAKEDKVNLPDHNIYLCTEFLKFLLILSLL